MAVGAQLDAAMDERFARLAEQMVDLGCDAILFTCSAFGPCIDHVKRLYPQVPVMKPNEAMIAQAAAMRVRVGLVATFAPTLKSMPAEFPHDCDLRIALADGALDALRVGDRETHDRFIADAARRLAQQGCGAIALAQFSMARARAACEAAVDVPVLTTVDSAVAALKSRLEVR
jgi:Asp/Glu/hydantoin racemase